MTIELSKNILYPAIDVFPTHFTKVGSTKKVYDFGNNQLYGLGTRTPRTHHSPRAGWEGGRGGGGGGGAAIHNMYCDFSPVI